MRTVTGADLGLQAVVMRNDLDLEPGKFDPVRNKDGGWIKPKGGLWTSTYLDPEAVSYWIRWCRGESWGDHDLTDRSVWTLQPRPDAVLLEIDTYADLDALLARYGLVRDRGTHYQRRFPDFEAMARDGWAGLHLTIDGESDTRLSIPDDLYGWDCESTCWFEWAFVGWARLVREVAA